MSLALTLILLASELAGEFSVFFVSSHNACVVVFLQSTQVPKTSKKRHRGCGSLSAIFDASNAVNAPKAVLSAGEAVLSYGGSGVGADNMRPNFDGLASSVLRGRSMGACS
ncbi:hypothetical protein EJ03DRAFT_101995 [Teratosphaeria nubilosa]|uniref:Secreted protein n=1 Tax=Teratosphaeria nubilosa TaxID=161662 RepID=A0A6G1LL58_9PEZI|nr:hypothetical protein EJ03DRAFT_101995 [Teratosphaeria nubilosa]